MVHRYCIPGVAGKVCCLDGFFSLLFCCYLTLITLPFTVGCINHAVHQREPLLIFSLKSCLVFGFLKCPRFCPIFTTFLCRIAGSTMHCFLKISPSATDSSFFTRRKFAPGLCHICISSNLPLRFSLLESLYLFVFQAFFSDFYGHYSRF